MEVRANADTPEDAKRARELGARGIGLCRTEHMFLGDRQPLMAAVILAKDDAERNQALEVLKALQEQDFSEIFTVMEGLPVTIRLLDPPLHEFLPRVDELKDKKATTGLSDEESKLLGAALKWAEVNPMLGTRGVRLGVLKPGLYAMQVRALMEAVAERLANGGDPIVEVMIPLTVTREELALARSWVERGIADAIVGSSKVVRTKSGKKSRSGPRVSIGTMIETPRAALRADEMSEVADFFSFGTNDLTQMTFGFSRDDVESRMMPAYLEHGLLKRSPFKTIDQTGVGELVKIASDRGRAAKPGIKLGVCGEHGGDPESIAFFHRVGLDYVSCSPYRVPIARLAAAQAVIAAAGAKKKSDSKKSNTK
jgi:pyruvate,orthophosphate dikinase